MRIIAGKYRGRPLEAPKGLSTRPTTSRAREALFSILGDAEGKLVLDLYAGSGALGLEALSRGARLVVFVEKDPRAVHSIRHNLAKLGAGAAAKVLECSVQQAPGALKALGPIDWVLADPPWPIAQQALAEVELATAGLLVADARVVIGHRVSEPLQLGDDSRLQLGERRRWGDSAMSFFTPLTA